MGLKKLIQIYPTTFILENNLNEAMFGKEKGRWLALDKERGWRQGDVGMWRNFSEEYITEDVKYVLNMNVDQAFLCINVFFPLY